MPLLLGAAAAAAAASAAALALLGPRLAAAFVARLCRHLLADRALLAEVGEVLSAQAQAASPELAAIVWGEAMRVGLQSAIVEMFARPDFHEAIASTVWSLTRHRTLKDTIREGVLEALRNEPLKAEVKAVFINALRDEEMRSALLRAAISTIKTGIREAVEDTELKEVIAAAIRDALEDPRLSGVMHSALKDALADQELHRATLQGAVSALNPFKHAMNAMNAFKAPSGDGFGVVSAPTPPKSPTPSEAAVRSLV